MIKSTCVKHLLKYHTQFHERFKQSTNCALVMSALLVPEVVNLNSNADNCDSTYDSLSNDNIWTTPSLEDPLRLPEGNDTDGALISSLFSNNNDRAKDLGFTSSDSEFISLDRFEDHNRGALVTNISFKIINFFYLHLPQAKKFHSLFKKFY